MDRATVLRDALAQGRYLRSIGPTTDQFMRWRDDTEDILIALLGNDNATVQEFREEVARRERLDAEGLQVHGQYGMWDRIAHGERILRRLLGSDAAAR